jgi:hypothetical protein
MLAMGALPVASRPKAGLAMGLARWRDVEEGGKGTEGGGVDGTASREARSGTTTGVGDDDGGTTGGIEAKGGVRDGAMGSVMATGVGDDDGGTAGAVKAEGGDGVASREATAQRVGNLGSLTAQTKISPRLGFCIDGVTPLIPDTLLVSTDIVQPIPKMCFMVSADIR